MIPGVPYDAEIEYLESTGTQWIDTEFIPDNNSGFLIKCLSKTTDGNHVPIGHREGSGNTRWYVNFSSGLEFSWNGYTSTGSYTTNTWYELSLNWMNSRKGVRNGVTVYSIGTTLVEHTGSANLFAHGYGKDGGGILKFTGFISYAKISSGTTLVRDFIPVRVGQIGYMYDRVTRRLFGNKGTGSFVLGPDVAKPVMGLWGMRKFYNTTDYVQDGLVAMWDGIDNTGHGHDPNATVWKDLVGGLYTNVSGNGHFSNLAFCMPELKNFTFNHNFSDVTSERTIEVVLTDNYGNTENRVYLEDNRNNSGITLQSNYGAGGMGRMLSNVGWSMYNFISAPFGSPITADVAFTPNSTQTNYFLNGNLVHTKNKPFTAFTSIGIGLRGAIMGDFYMVRVYNRALSTAEIAHNYAIDKARFNLP